MIATEILSLEEALSHEMSDPDLQDPIWKTKAPFPEELIRVFLYIRNLHKALFHTIEGKEACVQKGWNAQEQHPDKSLFGGGIMTVIREQILEKSAVNMSLVYGPKYPALEGEYAGKPFAAGGVSLISHPRNPNAPIMHLNIRSVQVDGKAKWIGGGADLTPMVFFEEDTALFHESMKRACPSVTDYEKYKKWADDYFYIPHRKENRGVGGIFFDFVPFESEKDLTFLLNVGQYAALAYGQILAKRISWPYDEALKEKHLYWRGRYAEFNLAYDRGTRFGLMTGGNSEAILCSMPPTVKW
ncbi:MAG: coproporphyrinogen III oxidase [Verrucomicrobia bacterium]|nr:coproporphyrinogen III oxidase [Verrucomicrobiota bacterium]